MSFEALSNPRTGEYTVLRLPAADNRGTTVADLYARPGATVPYEHIHPSMTETFTVVRGRLQVRTAGQASEAGPGTQVAVTPGVAHAWWNDGDQTAWLVVELDPGARFEAMTRTAFGLAGDGRTDGRGRPGLLQSAVFAREFDDVHRLVRPPQWASSEVRQGATASGCVHRQADEGVRLDVPRPRRTPRGACPGAVDPDGPPETPTTCSKPCSPPSRRSRG